jgi:hypothetical protein
MGVDADPGANIPLPLETYAQISALPHVVVLEAEHQRPAERLQRKYASVTNAPEPLRRPCIQAQRKMRAKEWYRKHLASQLRKEFLTNKDNALVEAQLTGNDTKFTARTLHKAPIVLIRGRATLANFIGAEDTRCTPMRTVAIQAMADLCSRAEPRRNSVPSSTGRTQQSYADSAGHQMDPATLTGIPMRCHPLQCLFYLGDARLVFADRNRPFGRLQALWKHANAHLDAIDVNCIIRCPHSTCNANGHPLNSVEHLLSHAHAKHGVRLQAR